jgi:hypothetical protein
MRPQDGGTNVTKQKHIHHHTACARNCDPRKHAHPYLHARLWGPQSLAHCVAHVDIYYSALYLNYTTLYVMFIQLKSLWLE